MFRASSANHRRAMSLVAALLAAGCVRVNPDQIEKATRKDCHFSEDAGSLFDCIFAVSGCASMRWEPFGSGHNGNEPAVCEGIACEAGGGCRGGSAISRSPQFEFNAMAAAAAVPASEREALVALYNQTGGPTQWFSSQKTNWLGAPGTECTWQGVRCDAAGEHVIGIAFRNYNLQGELPEEIGNLTELQELSIDGSTGLTGPLPAGIGNLKKLRALMLQQTMLSGDLPAALGGLSSLQALRISSADFSGPLPSALGNLGQLEALAISATRITGPIPAALGNLTKLRALDLRLNELTGAIPADLGKLADLEALFLDWNALTGAMPTGLGTLTKLRLLNLGHNRLTGPIPSSLAALTELETLTLDANDLSGPIPDLSGLKELKDMSLGFNALTGPLPTWLPSLTALEILYLPDNQLSGPLSDLSALVELNSLHLAWNDFEPGPAPAWLAAGVLTKLTRLDLSRTGLTGSIPDLSSLPLTHLAIGENAFDDGPVPEWIGAETSLVHLDLRATSRTGEIPSFLAGLDSLQSLFISDNAFATGPIPGFLNGTDMGSLSNLAMDDTQRTGPLPSSLFTLPLSTLRLARNELTGPIPAAVKDPLISILDLSQNQLSGALPKELGTQIRMQSLRLNGNKFSGEIPTSWYDSLVDEDMIDGTLSDDFGREFPGLDLRHNALTTSDAVFLALAQQKHKGGVDFQATQTVAPTDLKAVASGKNAVKLTWTAIPFSAGPGFYTIEMSAKAKGPFSVAGATKSKSATTFTVKKLKPKTQYFFRLRTTSAAHAENANELTSAPGAVVKFKTK